MRARPHVCRARPSLPSACRPARVTRVLGPRPRGPGPFFLLPSPLRAAGAAGLPAPSEQHPGDRRSVGKRGGRRRGPSALQRASSRKSSPSPARRPDPQLVGPSERELPADGCLCPPFPRRRSLVIWADSGGGRAAVNATSALLLRSHPGSSKHITNGLPSSRSSAALWFL